MSRLAKYPMGVEKVTEISGWLHSGSKGNEGRPHGGAALRVNACLDREWSPIRCSLGAAAIVQET